LSDHCRLYVDQCVGEPTVGSQEQRAGRLGTEGRQPGTEGRQPGTEGRQPGTEGRQPGTDAIVDAMPTQVHSCNMLVGCCCSTPVDLGAWCTPTCLQRSYLHLLDNGTHTMTGEHYNALLLAYSTSTACKSSRYPQCLCLLLSALASVASPLSTAATVLLLTHPFIRTRSA
jgi:hypothetical protein